LTRRAERFGRRRDRRLLKAGRGWVRGLLDREFQSCERGAISQTPAQTVFYYRHDGHAELQLKKLWTAAARQHVFAAIYF
jgi:hypothetical protein